jgi:hypothetical protein
MAKSTHGSIIPTSSDSMSIAHEKKPSGARRCVGRDYP